MHDSGEYILKMRCVLKAQEQEHIRTQGKDIMSQGLLVFS